MLLGKVIIWRSLRNEKEEVLPWTPFCDRQPTANQLLAFPGHTGTHKRHLLSGDIRVGARGRSSLWLPVSRDIQEVPYKDGVIMGTADDLELIKL